MKKTFKRAGVAVLSMAMLLSMGAVGLTANATLTPSGTAQCTVTLPATPTTATYKIYQVAASNLTNGAYVFSTVNDDFDEVLSVDNGILKQGTSYVADLNAAGAKNLAASLVAKVNNDALYSGTYDATTNNTIALDPGYYLIITEGVSGTAAPILFEIKGETTKTLNSKASNVTLDKGIQPSTGATLGSAGEEAGKTNAAANLGDTINYRIITDIPDYADGVTVSDLNADYVITDTPSGTTILNGATNVNVGGSTVSKTGTITVGIDSDNNSANGTNGYDTALSLSNDYILSTTGNVLTITLAKATVIANKGKRVVVNYQAVINDSAVISTDTTDNPNTNTAKLDYDNEYHGGGSGLNDNEKPSDENHLYTASVDLTKTFGGTVAKVPGAVLRLSKDNGSGTYVQVGSDFTTTASENTHTWEGLGAGSYKIEEVTTPSGYVTASEKAFTITPTPDNGPDGSTYVFSFTGTDSNNDITMENKPKDTLPLTGGMGTILFTVGGAAVVLLAGALFVVYMRRRKVEE